MAHSHAEVPSLPRPQCGASFSAEIGLSVDAAGRPDLICPEKRGHNKMFVPKSAHSTPRRIPPRIATQLAVLAITVGYVAAACAPPVTDAQINAKATEVVGQYPGAIQVEPAIPASGVNMATATTAPEVRPLASEAQSPAPTETVDTPESIYLQTLSNWDRTSLSMSDGVREGMDPDTRLQNMQHYVELNGNHPLK